jgi:diadenosine tetraphosphate (Ap4A) HIT family hydrolase
VGCPFCQLDRPLVAESPLVLAFDDWYAASPGHTLVIPRRHVATYFDCTPDEKAALWSVVELVREEISRRHGPDGFNVGFNAGSAAGQTVFHAHVHVIPRYSGDVPDPRGGVRHAVIGHGHPGPKDQ